MAKVTGPLFSLEARGKIADAMVHFPWKGLNVVRGWVKPANKKSEDQGDVRLVLGGLGRATRCAGATSPYRDDAKVCAGAGQTWVSELVGYVAKNFMVDATAFEAEYTAYAAHAQKTQFDTDALLLELADFDIDYKGTSHAFVAGLQLYMLARYGIAMRLLKEDVFDRVPYTVALAEWTSGNVDSLKTDLTSV